MGWIEIHGMKFYAFHGHFKAERTVGNNFEVDLKIKTDCNKVAESDNLEDALNYQTAYEIVRTEMKTSSYLLEHLAKRILDALYDAFPLIENASVRISKMNPPMGGEIERVSVTLER